MYVFAAASQPRRWYTSDAHTKMMQKVQVGTDLGAMGTDPTAPMGDIRGE